MQLRLMVCKSK